MESLSNRDRLFNEILKAVKDSNMEIGLIRAVLGEVDSAISTVLGRMSTEEIKDYLKERSPR